MINLETLHLKQSSRHTSLILLIMKFRFDPHSDRISMMIGKLAATPLMVVTFFQDISVLAKRVTYFTKYALGRTWSFLLGNLGPAKQTER